MTEVRPLSSLFSGGTPGLLRHVFSYIGRYFGRRDLQDEGEFLVQQAFRVFQEGGVAGAELFAAGGQLRFALIEGADQADDLQLVAAAQDGFESVPPDGFGFRPGAFGLRAVPQDDVDVFAADERAQTGQQGLVVLRQEDDFVLAEIGVELLVTAKTAVEILFDGSHDAAYAVQSVIDHAAGGQHKLLLC